MGTIKKKNTAEEPSTEYVVEKATTKNIVADKEIAEKPKSKIALFWETIPENRFEIIDMEAILA